MKVDQRIYDAAPVVVVHAEKHWSSKIDHVLDEKCGGLECCEVEISAWRFRVSWLDQDKANNLLDRNRWRSGLAPLPVWKRKVKKHAKRKANPAADKKQKIGDYSTTEDPRDTSPEPTEKRVRLISESDENENQRNVVCLPGSDNENDPESGVKPPKWSIQTFE